MTLAKRTIGEISTVVTKGTTPTTIGRQFTENGVNFIKAESLNGDSALDESCFAHIDEETHKLLARSILKENDVLVTIAGSQVGRCGYVKAQHLPANTNQAVGIVRVDPEKEEPRFVYYFFKQKDTFRTCQSLGGQAAQPNVNLTVLKSLKLPVPSRGQQQRIARMLSNYDDLIENNRRRILLLEQSARVLYQEWFVRLRFPGHEHIGVVNGVPCGWQRRTMADIAETVGGGTPSTEVPSYWENGTIPWFTPSDLTGNECVALLDSEKKITEEGLNNSSAKMLPPEAILMSSRASIGFFGMHEKPACTNQGFISLIPRDERHRYYLLYNLMHRRNEIISHAGGTTYKEINKSTFRALPIVLPDGALTSEFADFAGDVMRQVRALKRQGVKLREARDLLLPRLMSGEIEV